MDLAVLYSGGKDSNYALYLASKSNKIKALISIESENKHSYMFHTPNINLTELQSKALNIPLIKVQTRGQEDKELKDLEKAIITAKQKYNIKGIVTGAIESIYQTSRIQKICNKHDLWCINPLWKKDQKELLQELIHHNFKTIITSIAAYPLNETWLGKEINNTTLKQLTDLEKKYSINPAGEGGEYESLVLDMPLFHQKITIKKSYKHYKEHTGLLQISNAELTQKTPTNPIFPKIPKYEPDTDILIISTLSKNQQDLEDLYYYEFIKPIKKIVSSLNLTSTHIPLHSITSDILKNHKKIIIAGTYLKDNDYLEHKQKFKTLLSISQKNQLPSFYICSGFHLLLLHYHYPIHKKTEIGFNYITLHNPKHLNINQKTLKVFELHNNSIPQKTQNPEIDILATKNNLLQSIKLKNHEIYASQFHPEVLQTQILSNFLRI